MRTSAEQTGQCGPTLEVGARGVPTLQLVFAAVLALVAACVDVGRGKLEPDAIPDLIAVRDRNAACGAAPPQGLTLWEVGYE